ncbi:MAG TPA: polyketide synthase, partial [Thermoanaerobaculia bacterium]
MSDSGSEPEIFAAGVAVIGMAGRFPGAAGVEELWRNLAAGVESISSFSEEELLAAGVDRALLADPEYVRAGAVLSGIDLFDAAFFGFSPREAEITDPQQRLFLECAWEALEAAGYAGEDPGVVGVYAGTTLSTYLFQLQANPEALAGVGRFRATLGNDKDHLSTWVSYKLNLRGPAVTVQTACSTSLVAVHLACQSLLNGECDLALAGGVTVNAKQPAG